MGTQDYVTHMGKARKEMASNKGQARIPVEMHIRDFHRVLEGFGFTVSADQSAAYFNGRRFTLPTRRNKMVRRNYLTKILKIANITLATPDL